MALPLWFWMAFWIIIWIIIMVILITFVILIMVKTKKFPDIKRDIKVEALFNQFSNGHSEGWLKSVKPVNNRKLITFIPIDLTDEEIENAQEVPTETIAVTDSQIHITPKGRYSNAYGKMYILPKEISEIINKLPKSLGDGFLKTSITEQLKADFLETIKQGTEARSFILKQLADGELSREALIKLEEKWEKFATSKLEELPKEAQQK